MMRILGWYSLIIITLSIIVNVANDEASGGLRLATVTTTLPILTYIILNMFY